MLVACAHRPEKPELYLNGATQPCLTVTDLNLGPLQGAIALWVGSGTEAYFANLRVSSLPSLKQR